MSKFISGVKRAVSPEALSDLKWLAREHGINDELIQSLKTSKDESRMHIRFFKRMMFAINGAVMTIGLALTGFGIQRMMNGFSIIALIMTFAGSLLFVKFASVFMGMSRAIKATESIAQKHDLI